MNIEELFDVADWISAWLQGPCTKQYAALQQKILQKSKQPAQQEGFEEEKLALYETIERLPLDMLSRSQIDVLRQLGIAHLLGQQGKSEIEKILTDNTLDLTTAAKRIQENSQDLNKAVEWSTNAYQVLSKVVDKTTDELSGNAAMLHVHFEGDAAVANFSDMKDWSEAWFTISRGFAMAANEPPENIRIVSAGKGSIIIDAVATLWVSKLLTHVIKAIFEAQEQYYHMVIAREHAKKAVRDNRVIQDEFDKELDNAEKQAIERVTNDAIETAEIAPKGDGERAEALKRAVKQLFRFMKKGGDVDIAVTKDAPEDPEDGQDYSEAREALRQRTAEAKRLSQRVRQLSHDVEPRYKQFTEEEDESGDSEERE